MSIQPHNTVTYGCTRRHATAIVEAAVEQLGENFASLTRQPAGADKEEALAGVIEGLMSGRLRGVTHDVLPRLLDAPAVTNLTDLILDGPGGEEPIPKVDQTPFVDIVVVHEFEGTPIEGVGWTLLLPNGEKRSGVTTASGRIRIDDDDVLGESELVLDVGEGRDGL
ncbi:MAG: hypothetical protein JKY37_08550 [Nannocystaceae bacterium]|nr:hypothetical protein [Nannocystaceae bacterium]